MNSEEHAKHIKIRKVVINEAFWAWLLWFAAVVLLLAAIAYAVELMDPGRVSVGGGPGFLMSTKYK